ncbi:MAG: lysophospholipase [Clostridia bacterium]|nr:lysophospholipase [Clostridia bacterium]
MAVHVLREEEFDREMETTVAPALRKVREDGTFSGCDGRTLCYHVYRASEPRANLVVVHGFTESSEKYDELSWYFLQSGLSVYLFDHRGHGKSFRAVPDKTLTHVERFEEYVGDLDCFLKQVVPHDLPLYLYSHSMGGGVAALYLEEHPETFAKAVLSSPMIAPSTGNYPAFIGKAICRVMILFGQAKKRIFLSGEYPGEEKFSDSCGNSEVRFSRYEKFRRTHEDYQNFSPTYRWTLESLKVPKKILKKGRPEKIKTDVLICSAGLDNMVLNPPQKAFASRVPSCRLDEYPESKHEIFISTDGIMEKYVPALLEFYFDN